jgi:hypothetical protein
MALHCAKTIVLRPSWISRERQISTTSRLLMIMINPQFGHLDVSVDALQVPGVQVSLCSWNVYGALILRKELQGDVFHAELQRIISST